MSAVVIPLAARRPRVQPKRDYGFLVDESMAKISALFATATPAKPDVLDEILATLQRIEQRLIP